MPQNYQHIMVAVDGSREAELAFEKAVQVSLRNKATLIIAHVIDIRALQSFVSYDSSAYHDLEQEAQTLLNGYKERATTAGLTDIKLAIEMGNPKVLLAQDIPDAYQADLLMLGATGLNAFERLMIGSSSEYIMRHAKIDILIVRDKDKLI